VTWLQAVNYSSKFYYEIKNMVPILDSEHIVKHPPELRITPQRPSCKTSRRGRPQNTIITPKTKKKA